MSAHTPHELHDEFPHDAEALHRLKLASPHFARLAERHHEVNREIHRIAAEIEAASDERIEALTADWTTATTDTARAAAADAITQRAFETVPFIHCGQFQIRTAYRRSLTGLVEGGAAFMWNIRRV